MSKPASTMKVAAPVHPLVHLAVSIRAIPFISDHQSLRIGASSADVSDALEQVEGKLAVEQVRHKELLPGEVVDSGPCPSTVTCLLHAIDLPWARQEGHPSHDPVLQLHPQMPLLLACACWTRAGRCSASHRDCGLSSGPAWRGRSNPKLWIHQSQGALPSASSGFTGSVTGDICSSSACSGSSLSNGNSRIAKGCTSLLA